MPGERDRRGGISSTAETMAGKVNATPSVPADTDTMGLVPQSPANLPELGTRFGGEDGKRFALIEMLGSGGMGAVFLARDNVLERTIALKFILSSPGSASRTEIIELFRQEARATARLNHENIMRVFDLGTYEGMPFLVMEYLQGQTLANIMQGQGFDTLRGTRIMIDIARGLSHAHRAGIVHRDLKPRNVFLVNNGQAKILDFGLATILQGAALHGGEGNKPSLAIMGTPLYMSPEQWRGEQQDGRTDLWAAGIMFFELLCGRPPLDDTSPSVIYERLISPEPLPSAREMRPDLPPDVDLVLSRALSKDINQRFGTADELLDALVRLEMTLTRTLRAAAAEADGAFKPVRPRASQRQMSLVSFGIAELGALSARLDLEALSLLLANFFEVGVTVVRQLEGTVVSAVGGRVLACFGHPVAHEDDAQRAVRAGLLAIEGLRGLAQQSGVDTAVQIGVYTGPVVVGSGNGGRNAPVQLLGDAPDVAMWLERQAEANTIVISERTAALTDWLFDLSPLGSDKPESGVHDLSIFRVDGQRAVAGRFERAEASGLTPLVGRDQELGHLSDLWKRTCAGQGQFVLVSGEAGIGKSRLVESLKDEIVADTGTRLAGQCWAYFRNAALHPLIEVAQRTMEISVEEPADDKLRKIEALLRRLGLDAAAHGPLLANLLSIPIGAERARSWPPITLSPDLLKMRLLETFSTMLIKAAEQRPMLLVIEDVHWSDASTLELLGLLLDRIARAPLMVLLTFRPDFAENNPWPARAHLTQLALTRLGTQATAALVALASRGRTLPDDMVEKLCARADGIPLFVEELTRMVVDSYQPQEESSATGGAPLAIPATLSELLLARLDRLAGAGKEVAQLGAVLGREFTFTLIERASHLDGEVLRGGLLQLVEAGLLRHAEGGGGARYFFKHALIQEAALRSLLTTEAQRHHLRVAETLERDFPEVTELQPELLAHHYLAADAGPKALPWLEKAGQRAVQRSANTDAISHYRRAIEVVAALPASADPARKELELRLALGAPLMALKGYANTEVEASYARAMELSRSLGDEARLFPATLGLWHFSMVAGKLPLSVEMGEKLLAQAEAAKDATSIMLARRALTTSYLLTGRPLLALDHATQGLALYDIKLHGKLAFRVVIDPGVAHGLYKGWSSWILGYSDDGFAALQEAVQLGREIKHPGTLAFALCYLGIVTTHRGDYAAARDHGEEAMALSAEHRMPLFDALGRVIRGWALCGLMQEEEGIDVLRTGVERWKKTGARSGVTFFNAAEGWALLLAGRHQEALAVVDQGMKIQDETGERVYHAELQRLRAEALLAAGDSTAGEALLCEALTTARQQQARAFELRIALSYCRLLRGQERSAEALQLIGPIYESLLQGLDTVDLVAARQLVDELRKESA